ncbi:MAG: hypothetical protein KA244_07450 [Deltaproteobacteria bacterium]|nr:hypothetical protein [Deltaproteobacteria bacterium]
MGLPNPGATVRPKADAKARACAVVVDKSRPVAKKLARVLVSAGYTVKTFEELQTPLVQVIQAEPAVQQWLLVGESGAAAAIGAALSSKEAGKDAARRVFGVVYGGDGEIDVPTVCESSGVLGTLGVRPGSQRLDLESELLGLASFLRGQPLLPLQAYLLWGAQAFSTGITNIGGRDAAEARLVKLCTDHLNVSKRLADSIGEVVHELITNAMYDAPVDQKGRPLYAHDRTAPIELPAEDRVIFRYGTDGSRLVVETSDRFGRLRRSDLLRSLRRAASGQVNRGPGGAGIGLSLVCRTAATVQVDVEAGVRTRVTAVLDLEPARSGGSDGPRPGRSLIFPDLAPAPGST